MGMTKEEFKPLVKAMKAVYADPKFIPDQYAFSVWYEMLKDIDYRTASEAIQRHLKTSKFPPAIADIREQCISIIAPVEINEMEAWSMVSKAISNGYYGAEQEFGKLPAIVQKAVGVPGNLRQWAQTDIKSVESVIQSNFIKTYREILKKDMETKKYKLTADRIAVQGNERIGES